jgi:GntR family transcriptional repressor for pyruvate dehydrogenase complex
MADSLKRSTRRKPVYIRVEEQIMGMVREGQLTPGDQLLPERELAEKLGVSRTSVRQALAVLDGRGVIEITPRDGAYVRRQSLKDTVEPLTQVLFQERSQVSDLFEVREIIETQAVRLAALRRDGADLERLRRLNREYEGDLHRGDLAFEANSRFHRAIVETAKNPLLTDIMGPLLTATMDVYVSARHRSLSGAPNLIRFVNEHEQIIDAVAHQNPDLAAELLAEHIKAARERVREEVLA